MTANRNETQVAAELQATKDDSDEWGQAEPAPATARGEKRRLAAMVSVRLTAEELAAVQDQARRRNETVSGYLRRLALGDGRSTSTPTKPVVVAFVPPGVSSISTSTSRFVSAAPGSSAPGPESVAAAASGA